MVKNLVVFGVSMLCIAHKVPHDAKLLLYGGEHKLSGGRQAG